MAKRKWEPPDIRIRSREDFEKGVRDYLNQEEYINHLKQRCAADQRAIAERYDVQITPAEMMMDELLTRLEAWATENRPELLGEKKSLEIPGATVGFRMTPGKVVKRRKKDKLATIVTRLLALPWGKKYVKRPAPSLDKAAILKDKKDLTAAQLIEVGIDIDQHDEFYVEPKGQKLNQGAKVA